MSASSSTSNRETELQLGAVGLLKVWHSQSLEESERSALTASRLAHHHPAGSLAAVKQPSCGSNWLWKTDFMARMRSLQ